VTQEAYQLIDRDLNEQHARGQARRIRIRVREVRKNPYPPSLRWPFELLQNALDAGPRDDHHVVNIRLQQEQSKLIFEHDGAPFASKDLAALLAGGSSKELESEETTGRFGTGFLVTHVLAERVKLRGLLQVSLGCELFELALDRSGDEEAILDNTKSCNHALQDAKRVATSGNIPSATFEYSVENDEPVRIGFEALREALPYLYVTRHSLGRVELIEDDGAREVWIPGDLIRQLAEGVHIEYRPIQVQRDGVTLTHLRAYRSIKKDDAKAAALLLVEQAGSEWRVRLPENEAPKIYREYPLRGSGFVPINFIFDGKFDPDQERTKLLMTDGDKALLEDAFAAAVRATEYAIGEKWIHAHLLARASAPAEIFEPANTGERQWWTDTLTNFAKRLATLSIIDVSDALFPAIASDEFHAAFVVPRLLEDSAADETTIERLWPLVEASSQLFPPQKELAADWTGIARGWYSLGVGVVRITVEKLAHFVGHDVGTLDELRVDNDPTEWLAEYLDIVGECWSKRAGVESSVLKGLMPDQHGRLRSPAELHRDIGVSTELKDICRDIGLDIRTKLLLSSLETIATTKGLSHLDTAIKSAIPEGLAETQVIDMAIQHLGNGLPEDEECEEQSVNLQCGAIRLIHYLWESQGKNASSVARRLPLITSDARSVRWSPDRMMMAPTCNWHGSARPFANAYPPQRVLADFFAGDANKKLPDVIPALIEFGMAIADPITTASPLELKGPRLSAISLGSTDGVVVSNQSFSQIALLQPEVLNRCQESIDEARSLLGLVLCHVAPHDLGWQQEQVVKGRKNKEDIEVSVRGALWLADLKFRTWVPVIGEDGKLTKLHANAHTLESLLDPAWLRDNSLAIKLLSELFDFDELELRLLGVAPDPTKRRELRSGIAKLVETGGPNPELYASLAGQIEEQQRRSQDIDRCKRLGIAVQEAVKLALEYRGLNLKLIDRGFDYEVRAAADEVLEDAATRLEIGPYLLEVKATRTGQARLTPAQAEMASVVSSRYVLCVVDLRGFPDEDLDAELVVEDIEVLAKITCDIGESVKSTCRLVHAAKRNSVGIRNDTALRYEVPSPIWESGISITEWAAMISTSAQETR
jgi:hypothetical protein